MAQSDTPTRRGTNKLSTREIDAWIGRHRGGKLRPDDPTHKLTDGDGMYLFVTPAGAAVWRLKYRHDGIEKTYSMGQYPEIGLAEARAERDRARADLREGRDPTQARAARVAAQVAASDNTFDAVARDWLTKQKKEWSATHYTKSKQALERDVFPDIGTLSIPDISPAIVTKVVEKIANRGTVDTARKVRQHIAGIFRLAQAKGLCDYKENPAEPAREILPKKNSIGRRPALLKLKELGTVLRSADKAALSPAVRTAHRLLAFSATRISNVVEAEWKEFHLEDDVPQWIIPRAKMKARDRHHDHKVILGPTIAAELQEWKRLSGGRGFAFPSPQGGDHISREALEKAYRVTLELEGKHTPHGWRSAFSTLAREEGEFPREVVELALDHVHDNEVARAYDRGERLAQRVKLYTWWDSQLAAVERGAEVVQLKKRA